MQADDPREEPLNPYAAPVALELLANKEPRIPAGDFHPFRTIWIRPRPTILQIIALNPRLHVMMLASLLGIVEALNIAEVLQLGDMLSSLELLGCIVVLGPISGLLNLWIYSQLIYFARLWFLGTGTRQHIRTAVAWSYLPFVSTLPLWIFKILLLDARIFTSEGGLWNVESKTFAVLMALQMIQSVLTLWGFVLLCNCVTEVQGYRSRGRGFGNVLLANLMLVLLVFTGGLLILLLKHIYW